MTGCVLRIEGKNLEVPPSMEVLATFDEGVNINVSNAEGDEFEIQKNEAFSFLQAQSEAMKALTGQNGFVGATLDFGVYNEHMWSKSYGFPPELVALAAQHQLELMVSIYASENT
jgi:hypothetical protein